MGVPHTVYRAPVVEVANPKSPSFKALLPSGYWYTWNIILVIEILLSVHLEVLLVHAT